MFRKTSKLLVYAIAMLIPLITGTVVVMAKPAPQTTYLYEFSGKVIDDARGRAVPEMDVQITCNNTFTSTIKCGQDGQWATSFNLSAVTATCDIELLLLPGYQSTRAEVYSGEVISPSHIHYTDIPYSPTPGHSSFYSIFYISKPMTVTQTSHFSIEWYTYEHDPDYPNDGNSTNPTKGADYITVIANALELAWPIYADKFEMPSETPERSDGIKTHLW